MVIGVGYAQGDLFLDKVFLLWVFLFETILMEIGVCFPFLSVDCWIIHYSSFASCA